MEGMRFLGT